MKTGLVIGLCASVAFLASCTTPANRAEAYWAMKDRKRREKILADLKCEKELFVEAEPDSPCLLDRQGKNVRALATEEDWKQAGLNSKAIRDWTLEQLKREATIPNPIKSWALLETPSLKKVFPTNGFLRVVTPSDPFVHWILKDAVLLEGGRPKKYYHNYQTSSDQTVEAWLNASGFRPSTAEDARMMVFAFAEICGYTLMRRPPPLTHEYELESAQKAKRVDWSMRWRRLPDSQGWRVTCVFCTLSENWSCDRFVIEIRKDGQFTIKKRIDVFCAFGII